ncbi:heterokaryon incompatibility protein [Plectosphaerella cucumerina]|uniref:Heterokaryon incompatibility protein n=1 Tax=Plectosphaerella cucumerina TaxID=40658 RepID=A0A8K0TRV5_9PEZI|nr:heterokaryon incompatibility protein [Plectosphaerella cucumerina]
MPFTEQTTGATGRRIPFLYDQIALPDDATHIRLLQLQPSGESGDEHMSAALMCTMSTAEIANPPPFEALSYVWGPPDQPRKLVSIAGIETEITKSLDTALRYLRHQSDTVTLWVDQVCINQKSVEERMKQVALMSDVYSKASKTLVWLGEAADGSDHVMDTWIDIGEQAAQLDFESHDFSAFRAMVTNDHWDLDDTWTVQIRALACEAGSRFQTFWHAFKAWQEREWFTRLWVVQEFSLSPNPVFVCGHKRVPGGHTWMANTILTEGIQLTLFEGPAAPQMADVQFVFDDPLPNFIRMWRRRQKDARGLAGGDTLLNLLRFLYIGQDKNATDPRDRVYGLLGLAVDSAKLSIMAEYGDREVQDVLVQVASALVDNGMLQVLSYSQYPKEHQDLPSWVPDWRPHLRPTFHDTKHGNYPSLFSAGGNSEIHRILLVSESRKLGLGGFTVDVIEEIGEEWRNADWADKFGAFIAEVKRFHAISLDRQGATYESEERRAEAVWRIPVADMGYDSLAPWNRQRATPADVGKQFEACEAYCEAMNRVDVGDDWRGLLAMARELRPLAFKFRQNMGTVEGKRPFLTRSGFLGMAVSGCCPEDVVVVFRGGSVPYVLRPLPRGEFQLLGEAYCDGVMDGEIVGQRPVEDFILV